MTDLSGNCPECYEYPGDKHHKDCSLGIDRAKPDASPIVWSQAEIVLKGHGEYVAKSAYDALSARVAELESRSWICYTCGDGLKPLKKLMEIENLNKELADAEAEIERLQHVINYDMPHPQLTQAQQRIKELEAQADAKEEYCGLQRRVQAEIREREAKLVAALQTLCNEVKGTLSAHEIAIRYDSGNSNWTCLEVALATAEAALKANKGGA